MNKDFLVTYGKALDFFDFEADTKRHPQRHNFIDVRKAFANARNAIDKARRVLGFIDRDESFFKLGAHSPFTRYIRDYVTDFSLARPNFSKNKRSFNQVIFNRECYLAAATAALQFVFNQIAVARCFLAAYGSTAATVIARIECSDSVQTREKPFEIIDDAIHCAELDNFVRASIRVFDDRDLSTVLSIFGNDQSYFSRRIDDVFDAVTNQCRANILRIWFDD